MFKKSALPVILLILYINVSAQNNIGVFDNCNYSGKSYYLAPGSYGVHAMGIGNDKISSLQIPNGMRVTVYEDDNFKGRSATYTSSVACLSDGFNDNVSSLVVESLNNGNWNNGNNGNNNNGNWGNNNNGNWGNDYVTFYNDCQSRGYSQSLRPGTYYGNQLGILRENVSSFYINGNLRVKMYFTSDNASGYSTNFDESQNCLSGSYNDKVKSIVIERRTDNYNYNNNNGNWNNNNGGNNFATVYADCYFGGSSLRLEPGNYQGDKLGLMRYNISSIKLPSNLRARVYTNSEYLSGTSYTITESSNCLSNGLNNQIASLIIEEQNGYYNNNNNNNNYNDNQLVTLYTDTYYKGLSSSILPGTYATMEQAGFITKNLSSITVPTGYRVVLYEKENLQGKSFTITASRTSFSLTGWNDRAASIAVYRY